MQWQSIAAASVLAAGAGLAATAWADTHVISRSGAWEAFGGTTTNGRAVCGMSSSVGGRYFGLKYFAGDSTATIQLGSNTWNIDNGAKQKVTMTLDNNAPWNATATGMHFNDGDAGLEYTINKDELGEFMREFRASAVIRVIFVGSDATPWTTSLNGTDALGNIFNNCVRELR